MSIAAPNIVLRCDYCRNALYHSTTPEVDSARDCAHVHGWMYTQEKDSCNYCSIAFAKAQRDALAKDASGWANDRRQ